jgi:hypothetical protein
MPRCGQWADAAAVALSAACLAHCLALPLLASMLPVLTAAEGGGWVHWAFALLAAPAAMVALRSRRTSAAALDAGLQASAASGVALLAWGATRWPMAGWGTPLTVAGALVLAAVHVINVSTRHPHGPHEHRASTMPRRPVEIEASLGAPSAVGHRPAG